MFFSNQPTFVLASPDRALLTAVEPILLAAGGQVHLAASLDAALAAIAMPEPPALVLLDADLPASSAAVKLHLTHPEVSNLDRLLAAATARSEQSGGSISIIVIADEVTDRWHSRLHEGVIDDFIPRSSASAYWGLRIEMVLRNQHKARELETFREAAARDAQIDHLTGVFNRETILAKLFRETDRVQRMNGALSLVLLDMDDFGHWNSRFGNEACDDVLCQVAGRITRCLRSYDLLGRPGKDEFLLVLPGCTTSNAAMLAERIRLEAFNAPFNIGSESVCLSASFGIAASQGRSPVVVLREAEQALREARMIGPETIRCFGESRTSDPPLGTFVSLSRAQLVTW